MSGYRLVYFNFRGLAETARLILAQANIDYEDVRIEMEEWPNLKAKTPTGQLPVLEAGEFKLSQSRAIARYLAIKHDLAGSNLEENAKCDMLVDFMEDILPELIAIYKEQDAEGKAKLQKKCSDETIPKFCEALEKLMIENNGGDGFFVGNKVTWADLHFINFLSWPEPVGVSVDISKYPKLKALDERVKSLKNIAQWIAKRPQTSR